MSISGKWFGFGSCADYDEGLRHFDVGAFVAAIEAFHRALRTGAEPGIHRLARFYLMESYRRLATTKIDERLYADAVAAADAAIAIRPDYPDLYVLSARGLFGLEELDQADLALDRALQLNPNYAEATYLKGAATYAMGDHESGLRLMREAIDAHPRFGGEAFESGAERHEAGDLRGALSGFLGYTARIVDEANARANYGDLLVRERKFEEAAEAYAAAAALQPGYADIRCKYGQTLLELDRLDDALVEFDAAIAANSNYVEAHAQRGIALKRLRRLEEAKSAFERAYELDDKHPIARMESRR